MQKLTHASISLPRFFPSCSKASRGDKIVHSGGQAENVDSILDDDDDDEEEEEEEEEEDDNDNDDDDDDSHNGIVVLFFLFLSGKKIP